MGAFDRTDFALGRYKNAEEVYNKLIEEAQTPQAEQPGFALLQLKSLKNFIKSL